MSKPCQNQGFIIDGFPKTRDQAQSLFERKSARWIWTISDINWDYLLDILASGQDEEAEEEEGGEEEGKEVKFNKLITPGIWDFQSNIQSISAIFISF